MTTSPLCKPRSLRALAAANGFKVVAIAVALGLLVKICLAASIFAYWPGLLPLVGSLCLLKILVAPLLVGAICRQKFSARPRLKQSKVPNQK